MPPVAYRRIRHAAHYTEGHPAQGHDLDEWTVSAESVVQARLALPPEAHDAEYLCGYGGERWIFVRRAPLSPGHCAWCAPKIKPSIYRLYK